ncbi:hypothetical protein E3N88_14097 [Mikania micrantha]|uniref:Uncharacterized protein n=1 Tax=Mikania micrantha TaxID=192012 RepID=A0A5N6P1T5_9ASTR|nr:hypothetical protein E3N88_14097 [Mikania micrantha]
MWLRNIHIHDNADGDEVEENGTVSDQEYMTQIRDEIVEQPERRQERGKPEIRDENVRCESRDRRRRRAGELERLRRETSNQSKT